MFKRKDANQNIHPMKLRQFEVEESTKNFELYKI